MKRKKSYIHKIYRKKTIQALEKKINLLGETDQNVAKFLNTRLILSILIFLILFFLLNLGYLIAPILTIVFYFIYEKIVLDYPIKKRGKKLEHEAIFFFEIVTLTLESSRNLKKALELTANNINSELASEFKKALNEMKLGKSFNECLIAMKERIPSDAIGSIILNLTESSIFGNSIMDTINNQIDFIREKKHLEIKGEINKLPTKISIVSVIFFIPLMLLIILSPILLELFLK